MPIPEEIKKIVAEYVERKTVTSSSPISVNSHHGINYVSSNYTIERTTAPIRKVSYTQTKI